jgi:hypothetical protein
MRISYGNPDQSRLEACLYPVVKKYGIQLPSISETAAALSVAVDGPWSHRYIFFAEISTSYIKRCTKALWVADSATNLQPMMHAST